ncbi:unnamed protein product [Fusarium langsethiae]|nr:unnamed protein product [Fusarium langsethiae]
MFAVSCYMTLLPTLPYARLPRSNWPLGMKNQSLKENRAKTEHRTLSFQAWFQPDDTSVKAECAAVTDFNALSDVPANDFWEYAQRFGNFKDPQNWLARYPTLGRQVSDHQHVARDGQHVLSIRHSRFKKHVVALLMSREDVSYQRRERVLIPIDTKPHATSQDRHLAKHVNHQVRMQFDKKSASHRSTTISEYAKQIARESRYVGRIPGRMQSEGYRSRDVPPQPCSQRGVCSPFLKTKKPDKTGSYYPSVFIEVPEATEVRVGTSYTNPATARFADSLAVQIYRDGKIPNAKDAEALQEGDNDIKIRRGTILIVTPYLSQKSDISFLLSRVTAVELPSGLVEVRTVDSSLSHSASVVIADVVRTGRRDFTDDADRVVVMFSRAELATITIGRAKNIPENSRLATYMRFLEDPGAVYSLENLSKWHKLTH